ncbi:MFS transporter [Aciditerrimonas ferrireducens]|uniref:MFS transporter n=1 Tax=Aciditerrimonas ferrireducens TaxID=667306 RepID=UPI002005B34F|nr:MFS transporter [Aciditerrimonas ferrireducens]MCK4177785.1 MFS transporter [Aciditerrimonas ferrireducens]
MPDDRSVSSAITAPRGAPGGGGSDRYKWLVLSNTTVGVLMAMIDGSALLIALPAIFRSLHMNPLDPANFSYLLWMLMGYLLVTAVLVVTIGRIGDIFGRVRTYNLGFAIFTAASAFIAFEPWTGSTGALAIIIIRLFQAVGGAFLFANSGAILTDAFPADQRGMAMGVNNIAGIIGSFIGLVLGGILASIDWRLVFLINVPIGVFATVWAYWKLEERGIRTPARIDWFGNLTFAGGLTAILVAITYGIRPYGHDTMGWTSPLVLGLLAGGVALLVAFVVIEHHVAEPMFRMSLFRIRAFAAGNIASLLAAIGRGGFMFILVIWLQGIWLPLHGYAYQNTPLWAGIYMLPFTFGFLVCGPISGKLSDRYGARWFATGGMLLVALDFGLFLLLPVNFSYPLFALLAFGNGAGMGLFAAPNMAAIMNAVPARERGAASGMRATFMNTGLPLSMGIFFSLMITGLASRMPKAIAHGLVRHGVAAPTAAGLAHLPPMGYLFAGFLGYNPMATLLGPKVLGALPKGDAAVLTGKHFFPSLIAGPFHHGLEVVFVFAIVMLVIAGAASWMRGEHFVHDEATWIGGSEQDEAIPEPVGAAGRADSVLAGAASPLSPGEGAPSPLRAGTGSSSPGLAGSSPVLGNGQHPASDLGGALGSGPAGKPTKPGRPR